MIKVVIHVRVIVFFLHVQYVTMVYRQLFVYYFIPRLGTSFITQCHVKSINLFGSG